MRDRVPQYPGRVQLVPVTGQTNTYDMSLADSPSVTGTPLNKANLLTDATATALGLDPNDDPSVNDAFATLAYKKKREIITSSGTWTVPANIVGNVSVRIFGGGGGGYTAAGGGGGGGYMAYGEYAMTEGDTYTVTIGAGGAPASDGGTTSFGTLLTANGGLGSTGAAGGAGGTGGGGGDGVGGAGDYGGGGGGTTAGAGGTYGGRGGTGASSFGTNGTPLDDFEPLEFQYYPSSGAMGGYGGARGGYGGNGGGGYGTYAGMGGGGGYGADGGAGAKYSSSYSAGGGGGGFGGRGGNAGLVYVSSSVHFSSGGGGGGWGNGGNGWVRASSSSISHQEPASSDGGLGAGGGGWGGHGGQGVCVITYTVSQ